MAGTETFPYTITFSNGIYEVFQAANGNAVATIPVAEAVIKTHPSLVTLFYFGTSGNIITLDYTLCTNLAIGSRKILIDAIIALAGGIPLGSVTISGQPILVTPTSNLGDVFSGTGTRASSGTIFIFRPAAAQTNTRLLLMSGSTATALSAGTAVYLQKATITGGAWAVSGLNPGSQMEFNTGGAISATSNIIYHTFAQNTVLDLTSINITIPPLETWVLGLNQSGLGSSSASLTWSETP